MKIYYQLINNKPVNLNTSYIEGVHTHTVEVDLSKVKKTAFGLENEYAPVLKKKKNEIKNV